MCLQRWLKPLYVFRRMEISADTREASATGTFGQPGSLMNPGTVGESEHATAAVWEPGAGSQPGSPSAAPCGWECSSVCWEELAGDTGAATGDMEGELLMGMVSEGKGWSIHQFLGSCSVTDQPCQAHRAAMAAPRVVPRVATSSLPLLIDL